MIYTIVSYLQYPFVKNAVIVGVLISLCSSILGVTLVLRRFSFIGDGLSHVAFGTMAVAAVTGITNQMAIVLPVTAVSAILLLRMGDSSKIKGDASIAMLSVSALAIGYLVMNVFPTTSNVTGDACSTLFGSSLILTLSRKDVITCIVLSLVVIVVFVLFYNKIFLLTFDENFAKAIGVKVNLYNLVLAIVTAIIVVLAMNLVGSLLISALVIFPALSAMRVCKSFKSVTISAAVLSVICSLSGILISIAADTPVGSTIVVADIFMFIIMTVIGKLKK